MADKELKLFVGAKLMQFAKPQISRNARFAFERAKASALIEFNNHPITQALENHTSGGLGEGTLFGFIGFDAAENPIEPIRTLLNSGMEFGGIIQDTPKSFKVTYFFPSKEDIYDVTPLPWAEGRSWAEMIDTTGIPGLGLYLGIKGKGRSEEGVQNNRAKYGGAKYTGIPYIRRILFNFERTANKFIREVI